MPVSVTQVSPVPQSESDWQPEEAGEQIPVSVAQVCPLPQSESD